MALTQKQQAKRESILGFDEVLRNLSREIQNIQGRSAEGLVRAAEWLRFDMDHVSPKIPVDTNNLRGSWFTETFHQGKDLGVVLGFTANYALWVHEMVDADFTSVRTRRGKEYKPREGAGAKFMEAALNRNHDKILEIIHQYAKIQ